MTNADLPESATSGVAAHRQSAKIIVDCLDPNSGDLLALWLVQAGHEVLVGSECPSSEMQRGGEKPGIAVTDRFDPGNGSGSTISTLRSRYEGRRIIVVGRGGRNQPEVLAMARVSGADATVALPLVRRQVVDLIERLGS